MEENKNKISYTPTDPQKGELLFVYKRFEDMKTGRYKAEKLWQDDDDQYQMTQTNVPDEDWKARLKLPDTTSAILASLAEAIDQNPGITYMPREKGDTKRAENLNSVFQYTWEKGQGQLELMDHMLQASIYGTAIGKEYWKTDTIVEKEIEEYETDKDGVETAVPKKWKENMKTVFDDVHFKSIYIKNFWIDEAATSMNNAVDSVEMEMMDEVTFHQNYDEIYPDAKKVISQDGVEWDWYKNEEITDKVEVLYYYNCKKDMFTIVANGVLLTKVGNPNPYKHKELPYVQSVYIPKVRSFYGIGLPTLIRSLQEEKNTIRNMRLDQNKLNINSMILVDDKVEMDDEDAISEPNKIFRGPSGSIEFIKGPQANTGAYREEEMLRDDIIIATGVDARTQQLGGAGDTATEVAIMKESSLKRIRFVLKLMERMALYRIGRQRVSNVKQFYKMPKIKQVIGTDGKVYDEETFPKIRKSSGDGDEWFEADEKSIMGEMDVVVVTGATLPISKELEAQKTINLFDRAKGHPDVNQRELVRMLIDSHEKDSEVLLTKKGEPPMGQGQTQAAGGIESMPGQGQGNQGEQQVQQSDVMPAQQQNGVNVNQ